MSMRRMAFARTLASVAVIVLFAGIALAEPGRRVPNRRPTMPPKPPILNIPNGGRQAAFQPGHGAFGNVQSAAAGLAGQAGQAGQGGLGAGGFGGGAFGGFGGGGFGGGALGGGLGGGGAFGGGALGGGFGGGGLKGFGVGGSLLGPEPLYRNGVGLYGGGARLEGLAQSEDRQLNQKPAPAKSAEGYQALMLSPVLAGAVQ
jgi:hypothetical protein